MPTYGYRCSACGVEFERFQKMSDPPVTNCECGAQGTVKKRLFPVGIQFKGSGFYVNDYAKSGGSASEKSTKESTPAGEAKTETKTETKSEKTETTTSTTPAATSTTSTTTTT